ncbi:hypothetical protein PYJP_00550 [Pyrofollis japonicus]|uniref:nucleotidyltransferase domain-containing protein n=1 Tax=Pyrofollis japonicus TaxID=3060460 RepID=UPI00295C0419|nr:nucleotidyltransferase domain-containing protein [Pyrofollis japonicus]BEP16703.1 hypothetical protein PYJP_00550 [Pyrofollis japonicus]
MQSSSYTSIAEVYVIGSVAEDNYIAASDLDLLIVTNSPPQTPREEAEAKTRIEELANLPIHHPLEIHFAGRIEKENGSRGQGRP